MKNKKNAIFVFKLNLLENHFLVRKEKNELLDLIHTNVSDFNWILTRGGKRYFVTFIDDFFRFTYVYLIRTKDGVLENFKIYKAKVENQLNKKIKALRSDWGREYNSNIFLDFYKENGIVQDIGVSQSPQQNGITKWKNRTLLDMINFMLINSWLSQNLWGETLHMTWYILDKVPQKKIKIAPYELWKNKKPNLNYLRIWGCYTEVRNSNLNQPKLGPKIIPCAFLGYKERAYRFLDIKAGIIIISRDVDFFKNNIEIK